MIINSKFFKIMGKGDQKSKRGKITAGSYGKKRPRKTSKPIPVVAEKAEKPVKETKPKATPKAKTEKTTAPKETKAKETKPKATKTKKDEE